MPVTQEFFQAVTGQNPSQFTSDIRRPVENVSWQEAVDFCSRLQQHLPDFDNMCVRLPAEAEWEYACRAGSTTALYNDQELTSEEGRCANPDELAWYDQNSDRTTHPVGEKLPNSWGLHDMLGNVWEWCEDVWHKNYDGAPSDGTAWTGEGRGRVCRGGSWAGLARYCRCACRGSWLPGLRFYFLGFRLCLAPKVTEDAGPFS